MDHKPVLENSSSTAIYTLPNAIICFKVVQYSGLAKSCTCIYEVLEIINFTNYNLDYFLTGTLTNTLFQLPEYVKQL